MALVACTFKIVSGASNGQAAIAVVELRGDATGVLERLGVRDIPLGRAALRKIKDVDGLVVARMSPTLTVLFPHAGPRVLNRLCEALVLAGCVPAPRDDDACVSHQRPSLFQTRVSAALVRAQSPLAIDALLGQDSCWSPECEARAPEHDAEAQRSLGRLIDPPLVAALGRPNIGKSSLLNALAGRSVSIVADEPGTTRDHVGVHLNLAGLVVRYLDTPGIGNASEDVIQAEAQAAALDAARRADLLLLCTDASNACVDPPEGFAGSTMVVGVRADLGPSVSRADVRVSVRDGVGVAQLVEMMLERLVPSHVLSAGKAWRFWESL